MKFAICLVTGHTVQDSTVRFWIKNIFDVGQFKKRCFTLCVSYSIHLKLFVSVLKRISFRLIPMETPTRRGDANGLLWNKFCKVFFSSIFWFCEICLSVKFQIGLYGLSNPSFSWRRRKKMHENRMDDWCTM